MWCITYLPIWNYFSFSNVYFSIWYMSPSKRAIGTLPIVSLKKSSSIVDWRIDRNDGNNSNSRPKRVGCRGYRSRTWSDNIHCAWSWSISTGWTSHNDGVSGENRMTAFMHPTSLPSGAICRNRQRISWIVFISLLVNGSCGNRSRTGGLSSNAPKSHGTAHWDRFNRNNSFQDSFVSSVNWNGFGYASVIKI